jgi:methionyl aminopeptidase
MLVLGGRHTRQLADGWTVVSSDGTPAAHFEHTVAITDDGPWVLTAPDGGRERLAGLAEAAGSGARSDPVTSTAPPQI